jgi:multidrug efflux pump subunit AcrB
VIGRVEQRVLGIYGKSLTWFLERRWLSALIWVACLAGTVWFFIVVPKAFLPPGDSSVITGVFIAREGLSGTDARHPGSCRRGAVAEPQRHGHY